MSIQESEPKTLVKIAPIKDAPKIAWADMTGVQKSLKISHELGAYLILDGQKLEPAFTPQANYRRWLMDGTKHGIVEEELFVECVVITLDGDALNREIHLNGSFDKDVEAHWKAEADARWEAGEGWTVDHS